MHPALPPSLWGPSCPVRAAQRPEVLQYLVPWRRWQRYGLLPAAGGTDDQEARLLDAFDILTHEAQAASALPPSMMPREVDPRG